MVSSGPESAASDNRPHLHRLAEPQENQNCCCKLRRSTILYGTTQYCGGPPKERVKADGF
jgi:hypothetical protein